ncbi:MAG: acetyl-CoA carboxylase biotin carboxyl carrier protein subunit [Acidobacteria bacterium]|nr:acetyl-CoA carboxylase biotin carboxyl carrier protein subunit [Acidobacteriota bacterium]
MRLRIKIEGKTYEVDVEILDGQESAPEYPPYPPAQPTFVPAKLPEQSSHIEPDRNDEKECRSPVVGIVIKVNVEPGQQVEPDAVVVVLESMKMEMQITRTQGGLVKRVLVSPGAAVKADELMVEFA